ncbi:MAG: chemotaxis protein CheB [Acidobacteriota bacterium]
MTLRALVVDDSSLQRAILCSLLRSLNGVEVAGSVASGREALGFLDSRDVDLVLLDVVMPGLDGIETLKAIRASPSKAEVVMVSGVSPVVDATAVRARRHGAFEFLQKPTAEGGAAGRDSLRDGLVDVARRLGWREPTAGAPPDGPCVLVIAGSPEEPDALRRLLPRLPTTLPMPVLVVLPAPATLTASLAVDLNTQCRVPVREACDGEPAAPGVVYLAPGGHHLQVDGSPRSLTLRLDAGAPVEGVRPSADVTLRSLADSLDGASAHAIVLGGRGRDGVEGVRELKTGRCSCWTQAVESCVSAERSRALEAAGLSDAALDLDELGACLVQLCESAAAA